MNLLLGKKDSLEQHNQNSSGGSIFEITDDDVIFTDDETVQQQVRDAKVELSNLQAKLVEYLTNNYVCTRAHTRVRKRAHTHT